MSDTPLPPDDERAHLEDADRRLWYALEKLAQAAAELDLSGGPLHDHLLAAMRWLGPVTEHDLPVNLRPAYQAIRQAGRRVESRSLGSLVASLTAMSPEELDELASQIAMLYVEVARRVEGRNRG